MAFANDDGDDDDDDDDDGDDDEVSQCVRDQNDSTSFPPRYVEP